MDEELIYDVSKDAYSATEEIARSIELRSRGSVILELFAPTASAFSLLLTRKAWGALKKRFPQLALKAAIAATPIAGASASTGVGAAPAAVALTAAEVAALAYFFLSEVSSVCSLAANFPSSTEATAYMPAASTYDLLVADPSLIQKGFIRCSKEAVAFGSLYCCYFSSDILPSAPTKTRLYASLIAGWLTGYVPIPVLAFCERAQRRLGPYAGDRIEAIKERFLKDVLFVARYSGMPVKRLPLGMKLVNFASTTYNIGVASYNTLASVCRTVDCPATSIVTQEVVDFILSPSSVTWRLPFTSKSQVENYDINFVDIQATTAAASRAALTTNLLINEADSLAEEYNED